jgi:hypothetical protein
MHKFATIQDLMSDVNAQINEVHASRERDRQDVLIAATKAMGLSETPQLHVVFDYHGSEALVTCVECDIKWVMQRNGSHNWVLRGGFSSDVVDCDDFHQAVLRTLMLKTFG